jgi:hypothetical protein
MRSVFRGRLPGHLLVVLKERDVTLTSFMMAAGVSALSIAMHQMLNVEKH